jgi:Uncharacterized protein conserved in bacteria
MAKLGELKLDFELDSDKALQALGEATITDVGSENIYIQKDGVEYYAKIYRTQDFQVGPHDFSNETFEKIPAEQSNKPTLESIAKQIEQWAIHQIIQRVDGLNPEPEAEFTIFEVETTPEGIQEALEAHPDYGTEDFNAVLPLVSHQAIRKALIGTEEIVPLPDRPSQAQREAAMAGVQRIREDMQSPVPALDDERDIRGQALAAETQAIKTASVSAVGDATDAWATYQQLQSTAEAQGLTTQLLPSNENDGTYTLHYLDGERVTAIETEIRLPDGAALTTYDGEPITTDGFTTDPDTQQQALNAALARNQERNPSIEVNSEANGGLDIITFNGNEYPIRTVTVLGQALTISTTDLQAVLLENDSPDAEAVDNRIAYYVEPEEIQLPEQSLTALLRNKGEFEKSESSVSVVQPLSEQALRAEIAKASQNAVEGYNAQESLENLEAVAARNGMTVSLSQSPDEYLDIIIHYLKDGKETGITTDLLSGDGKAVTSLNGERIQGTSYTSDLEWQSEALQRGMNQYWRETITPDAYGFIKDLPAGAQVATENYDAGTANSFINVMSATYAIAKREELPMQAISAIAESTTFASRYGMTSLPPKEWVGEVGHLEVVGMEKNGGKELEATDEEADYWLIRLHTADGMEYTLPDTYRDKADIEDYATILTAIHQQTLTIAYEQDMAQVATLRQEVNQLIAVNEAYSPELAEKDGEWQLIVGIETLATYTNADEATQALSYVNNVGAAIALQMLHPERIPEGMDAVAIIADNRTPSLAEQEAASRQGNLYYETASSLEAARDNSSDKAIIAEVIQRLETAGFTNDGQASYVKDGIAVTTDNGATHQEPSVILLSQQNPDGSWQVNVGRSSEFGDYLGDYATQSPTVDQIWQQLETEISRLNESRILASQEAAILAKELAGIGLSGESPNQDETPESSSSFVVSPFDIDAALAEQEEIIATREESKKEGSESLPNLVEYLDLPEEEQAGFDYISGDNHFIPRFYKDEQGAWQDTMPPEREMHFLPQQGQILPFGKTAIQSVTDAITSEQPPVLQQSRRYGEHDIDLFADGTKVGLFLSVEKDFQQAQLQQWQSTIAKHLPDVSQVVIGEITTKAAQDTAFYQQVEHWQRTGLATELFAIGEALTTTSPMTDNPAALKAIGDIGIAQTSQVAEELPYLSHNNIQPLRIDIAALPNIQAIGQAFDEIEAKRKELADLEPDNWRQQSNALDKLSKELGQRLDTLYPEPDRKDAGVVQKGKEYQDALELDQHPLRNVKGIATGDRLNTPKKPGVAGVIGGVVEEVNPRSITVITNSQMYGMQRHKISKQALKGGTLFRDGEFYGISDKDREKVPSLAAEPNKPFGLEQAADIGNATLKALMDSGQWQYQEKGWITTVAKPDAGSSHYFNDDSQHGDKGVTVNVNLHQKEDNNQVIINVSQYEVQGRREIDIKADEAFQEKRFVRTTDQKTTSLLQHTITEGDTVESLIAKINESVMGKPQQATEENPLSGIEQVMGYTAAGLQTNIQKLQQQAEQGSIPVLSQAEFQSEINEGQRAGMPLKTISKEIDDNIRLRDELHEDKRTPQSIMGKLVDGLGPQDAKDAALEWLDQEIGRLTQAEATQGQTYPVNLSNYEYYLQEQIKEAEQGKSVTEAIKDFNAKFVTEFDEADWSNSQQGLQEAIKATGISEDRFFNLVNDNPSLGDPTSITEMVFGETRSASEPSSVEQAAIQSRADDLATTKPQGVSQEAEDLQRKAEALKDKQSSEAAQPRDNRAAQEKPDTPPKQENTSSFVASNQPAIAQEKTFLAIPFADKDKAKKAAGQLPQGGPAIGWDSNAKSWYANPGADLNKLKQWLPENVKDRQERPDPPEVEFAKALKDAGLELPALPIMDGAKHRVSAVGDKAGQKSGEYVGYKGGHPAGFIRNFRDESKTGSWKYTGNKVDQESVQDWRAINSEREAQKTAQLQAKHQLTANTVATAWENLRPTPNPNHPYLVAKGLQGDLDQLRKLGIKQDDKGNLVVPARDKDGKIWNMQRIGATGWKGFEKDAKLQGCFHVIGGRKALKEQGNNEPVIVSTGFGTAATIHLATGKPVIVAFNDNNLQAVAEEFKKIFPDRSQAIFGDDDKHLPLLPVPLANSGREKATTAAESVGGIAVFPRFAAGTEPTKEFSDFNDLQRQQGIRAVQRQVEQGLAQARSTVNTQKALEQAQAKDKPEKNRAGGMEIAR